MARQNHAMSNALDALLPIRKQIQTGQLTAAESALRSVLQLRPHDPVALCLLGHIMRATQRVNLSIELLKHSVQYDNSQSEAWYELGCSLNRAERYDEAIDAFTRAAKIRPDWVEPRINVGSLLERMGRSSEARLWHEQAAQLDPISPVIWYNLGNTMQSLGELSCATTHYETAIQLDPNFALAHWNLALCHLLQGNFEHGWREYQWRVKAGEVTLDKYPQPELVSLEQLKRNKNAVVIVHAEQGIGDEVMFASCIPDLAAIVKKVILVCDPRLELLFSRSFPSVKVLAHRRRKDHTPHGISDPLHSDYEKIDFQIGLGGLPRLFRNHLKDFPQRDSYLQFDRESAKDWKASFVALGRNLRIGISWRAGGNTMSRHLRSTELTDWLPILNLPGIDWINLQYGETNRERRAILENHNITIHDWDIADPLTDLDGFAAKMAALDLVISVGNTTVHLAGALGIPSWVILPRVPAWRWLASGETTPWYSSVRCFRQHEAETWQPVLLRIAHELAAQFNLHAKSKNIRPSEAQRKVCPMENLEIDNNSEHIADNYNGKAQLDSVIKHPMNVPAKIIELQKLLAQQPQTDALLVEAEKLCDELLIHAPRKVELWHAMAAIAARTQRPELAVKSYKRAIALYDSSPKLVQELAETQMLFGMYDEARESFESYIKKWPEHVEGWMGLGLVLRSLEKFCEAEDALLHARELTPENPKIYNFLGGVYVDLQRVPEAIAAFKKAIALAPNYTAAMNNLGCILHSQNQIAEALVYFGKIAKLEPNNQQIAATIHQLETQVKDAMPKEVKPLPGVTMNNPALTSLLEKMAQLFNAEKFDDAAELANQVLSIDPRSGVALRVVGVAQRRRGDQKSAEATLQKAMQLDPQNFALPFELGVVYLDLHEHKKAAECFLRVLEIRPDFQAAYVNMSGIMEHQERYEEALDWSRKAVNVAPNCALGHYNMANSLREQGMIEEAIGSYKRALELDPSYARAKWNLGICNLHLGNYAEGWPGYEMRGDAGEVDYDLYPQPRWNGESLAGKTIVIHAEQGLGDEIVFCSCIPDLIRIAGKVVIICEPRLAKLFSRSFPAATVHGHQRRKDRQPFPLSVKADFQLPMGSLPLFFRKSRESFPRSERFLTPDGALMAQWKDRLTSIGSGLKVGVSWRAGGKPLERRKRSIEVDLWEPIFKTAGVQFVNLQYGDASEDAAHIKDKFGVTLHDWEQGDPLIDIDSFAAKIASLDLVISVGNATVHLAGGLGTPAWTLLPMIPSWRWMIRGDESPWYGMVRLFRQRERNQWSPVLTALSKMLGQLVKAPTSEWRAMAHRIPAPKIELVQPVYEKPIENHKWLDHTQFSAGATMESIPKFMEQAKAAHEAGDHDHAEQLVRSVLQIAPKFPAALHLLGLISLKQGKQELAIRSLQRALAIAEMVPLRRCDLGMALAAAGRIDEAIASYKRAIEISPMFARAHRDLVDLYNRLGLKADAARHAKILGQTEESEEIVKTAANSPTDFAPPLTRVDASLPSLNSKTKPTQRMTFELPNSRIQLEDSGGPSFAPQPQQPTKSFASTPAQLMQSSAPATDRFADKLAEARNLANSSQIDPAIRLLHEVIQEDNEHVAARFLLAEIYVEDQVPDLAEKHLLIAMKTEPNGRAYQLLARIHEERRDYVQAIKNYERSLDLDPNCYRTLVKVGTLYNNLARPKEAEAMYRRALALRPGQKELINSIGLMMAEQGMHEEAMAYYREAIRISGDKPYPAAHGNLSFSLLQLGRYVEGWKEYEWRWQCPEAAQERKQFNAPLWHGESLAGKSILLHAEQGLGDEMMFATCYPDVLAEAKQVYIVCDPRLESLFRRSFNNAKIYSVPRGQEHLWKLPARLSLDFQISSGSLPMVLRPTRDSFPRFTRILQSDSTLVTQWRNRLQTLGNGIKVGISWLAGTKLKDRTIRSLTLNEMLPLLKLPGIEWINLQHGDVRNELDQIHRSHGIEIHDWSELNLRDDLENLAARMYACDLIVSVGNAAVHLAGSLGVPTLNLLPANSAWRWGPADQPTPWYSSVQVLRQSIEGNWADVIASAQNELLRWLDPSVQRAATIDTTPAESLSNTSSQMSKGEMHTSHPVLAEQSPNIGSSQTTTSGNPRAASPISAPHWSRATWPAISSSLRHPPTTSR